MLQSKGPPKPIFAPHRLRLWGVFVYPFPFIISSIFIDIIQEGFFMVYEVSRRSFLKGAAALAVATAASGLLTACGGGKGELHHW